MHLNISKVSTELPYYLASTFEYIKTKQKPKSRSWKRYVCTHVHDTAAFFKGDTTQLSINRYMDTKCDSHIQINVIWPYKGGNFWFMLQHGCVLRTLY